MTRRSIMLCVLLGATIASSARAQDARYELGRRLRATERAWDKQAEPKVRAAASRHLREAVDRFFQLQLADASRALDFARLVLEAGDGDITTTQHWAASLNAVPLARLIDAGRPNLPVTLRAAYNAQRPIIQKVGVHLSFFSSTGTEDIATTTVEVATDALPHTIAIDTATLAEGDTTLHAAIYSGKVLVGRVSVGVSVVERLEQRLSAAGAAIAEWPTDSRSTEKETARALLAQLRALAAGKSLETDVPAARRLQTLEQLLIATRADQRFFDQDQPGEAWVSYVTPGAKPYVVPVRQFVPREMQSGPRPLVIALHGAGGSENMFFDGYGDGAVVRLARARGWMVVAPRSAPLGAAPIAQLIDAVVERYPVDPKRIYLIGHSMGAAQAIGFVASAPGRVGAVAALGGGGSLGKNPNALAALPFFIGVGTDDFLLRRARDLRDAASAAQIERVEYREYPDIEHLAIVQVALPDVFRFFDALNAR